MAARNSSSSRLTVDDWLQVGYTLLAQEGIRALKVDRLCKQMGATRGSFYWHFEDIGAYRAALVESWDSFRGNERHAMNKIKDLPPRARLEAMMAELVSPQYWMLERAMREWARSDAVAAENLRAADLQVLSAVAAAYRDYGFSAGAAKLRAELTFAAGIGLLHLADSADQAVTASKRRRMLDLMLSDPD